MEKKSQCDMVLDYIKKYGSITTLEAFRDLGIARLASRICDLSKMGYHFRRDTVTAKNRWGADTRYTRYSME